MDSRDSDTAVERLIELFPPDRQARAQLQLPSVLRSVVPQLLSPNRSRAEHVPVLEDLVNDTATAAKNPEERWHQPSRQLGLSMPVAELVSNAQPDGS